jgi:hypothetical protein
LIDDFGIKLIVGAKHSEIYRLIEEKYFLLNALPLLKNSIPE